MQQKTISIAEYSYDLPADSIAYYPLPERDASKLLIYRALDAKDVSGEKPTDAAALADERFTESNALAGKRPTDLNALADERSTDSNALAGKRPTDPNALAGERPTDADALVGERSTDSNALAGKRATDPNVLAVERPTDPNALAGERFTDPNALGAERPTDPKVLAARNGILSHDIYRNIADHLPPGGFLVFNNTKVVEARIVFQKPTGGQIEIFCLEPAAEYGGMAAALAQTGRVRWKCLIGGASKWKPGQVLQKTLDDDGVRDGQVGARGIGAGGVDVDRVDVIGGGVGGVDVDRVDVIGGGVGRIAPGGIGAGGVDVDRVDVIEGGVGRIAPGGIGAGGVDVRRADIGGVGASGIDSRGGDARGGDGRGGGASGVGARGGGARGGDAGGGGGAVSVVVEARWIERSGDAFIIELSWTPAELTFAELLRRAGRIPLPPYIHRNVETSDSERYQTVYARHEGSVAAPTAGLHFTDAIFTSLAKREIRHAYVTLHVGAGTFLPVKAATMGEHHMHVEFLVVNKQTIVDILQTIKSGEPVIAVGTTSARTLESLYWLGKKVAVHQELEPAALGVQQWEAYEADAGGNPSGGPDELEATAGSTAYVLAALLKWMERRGVEELVATTQLLITPGYVWRVVSGLVTNFHQPESTLLLLVASLIGQDWRELYAYALAHGFRFLSYGDGCLLLPGAAG